MCVWRMNIWILHSINRNLSRNTISETQWMHTNISRVFECKTWSLPSHSINLFNLFHNFEIAFIKHKMQNAIHSHSNGSPHCRLQPLVLHHAKIYSTTAMLGSAETNEKKNKTKIIKMFVVCAEFVDYRHQLDCSRSQLYDVYSISSYIYF